MTNERYVLHTHEAHEIPRFYEENENIGDLTFKSRENGEGNSVVYKVSGFEQAECRLTMHPLYNHLVRAVEISCGEKDELSVKEVVEKNLKVRLLHSFPSQ